MQNKNKYLVPLLVLILILLVGVWGFWYTRDRSGSGKPNPVPASAAQQKAKPSFALSTKDVPKNQLPQGFPTDIPLETGANVSVNQNKDLRDGRLQATRTFSSLLSLDKNYTLYHKFFSGNGWTLDPTELHTSTTRGLIAKKGKASATITITADSGGTGTSSVSITVLSPESSQ